MFKKLNFIYIEMSKFKKQESELANHLEWWLYFLRELVTFDDIPNEFQGDIIEEAFHLAKLANMSHEDRHTYELSLKYYRDFINVMDTAKNDARKEGLEQGIEQGKFLEKIVIAKNLLQLGLAIESIVIATGLTQHDIENL